MNPRPIAELKRILAAVRAREDPELAEIVSARDEVLARYQPIFSREDLPNLTAEDFKSFLLPKNNRHWHGLHRHSGKMTADMSRLREALLLLTDESVSLDQRLRKLRPKGGPSMVPGLARSVITPILMVCYPEKYGVFNTTSATAMKELGLFPDVERAADMATRYQAVNEVLLSVAKELEIDLWTLDALWWGVKKAPPAGDNDEEEEALAGTEVRFGLEQHLHDFLADNWAQTELGQEWDLLEEEGDLTGYKYNTGEVGEIDLLAKHKSQKKWLVVELKRGRTSDRVVGQVLRYRGWVMEKLAEEGDEVLGLIIGHEADRNLHYALKGVQGVRALTYSVSFSLTEPMG